MECHKLFSKSLASQNCLIFFALLVLTTVTCQQIQVNPECKPRPVVVETGPRTDYFNTSAIQVYKCSGFETLRLSNTDSCVAIEWEDKIEYIHGHYSGMRHFKYANHTKCAMRCTCSNSLECSNHERDNKDKLKYLVECPKGSSWNFKSCKCQVAVPVDVGCNKKDEDSEVSISITMFVLALVIELIIVLIVIFLVMDACKYRQDTGILHKTAEFVRGVSNGQREDHVTLKRDRNNTGSESFLNGYSTVGGKIQNV